MLFNFGKMFLILFPHTPLFVLSLICHCFDPRLLPGSPFDCLSPLSAIVRQGDAITLTLIRVSVCFDNERRECLHVREGESPCIFLLRSRLRSSSSRRRKKVEDDERVERDTCG